MITSSDLISSLIAGTLFLVLFLIAEIWRRRCSPDPEHTRKFVHVGAGLIALTFPLLFGSHWIVLILAILFVGVFVLTRRLGILQSVQGVERITIGEILYPVAIYLIFLTTELSGAHGYYVFTILVLAISDTAAGLIGRRLGVGSFHISGEKKTLAGSFAFLISTVAIALLLGVEYMDTPAMGGTLLPLISVALVATLTEAVTPWGFDNVTIPVAMLGMLLLPQYLPETGAMNFILAMPWIAAVAAVLAILWKNRRTANIARQSRVR